MNIYYVSVYETESGKKRETYTVSSESHLKAMEEVRQEIGVPPTLFYLTARVCDSFS